MVDELHWMSISTLSTHIRSGELLPSEVVRSVLARIDATEPIVNAYAGVMRDLASEEAEARDIEARSGLFRGALHGIPIAVKDMCDTAGFRTEAGSMVFDGRIPEKDSTVVRKLRQAGAVIIGKTVTSEFAFGQNQPPTRNAWNQTYYPGGSSVGSAVAVAVGSAPGAIGTDTGGSIRVPASVNGVVGLKPTHSLVGRGGTLPISPTLDTVGPLSRTVEDCAMILAAIAGAEHGDQTASLRPQPDYGAALATDLAGIRVGIDRSYFFEKIDGEVDSAVDEATSIVKSLGATVVEVTIPNLASAIPAGMVIFLTDASEWHGSLMKDHGHEYVRETRLMLDLGELIRSSTYAKAQKVRRVVRDSMRDVFRHSELDVLFAPTIRIPVFPLADLSVDMVRGDDSAIASLMHNTFPANIMGVPGLSVPVGFSGDGLPIGMQIIAPPFREDVLFQVGHAVQSESDWHNRHPDY